MMTLCKKESHDKEKLATAEQVVRKSASLTSCFAHLSDTVDAGNKEP